MSVEHVWVGALTSESAWIRAKISGETARLAVAEDDDDFSNPVWHGPQDPTSDGMVSVEAKNLDPDKQYMFAVEVDGKLERSFAGKFRTLPREGEPASFSFWAASCAGLGEEDHISERVSDDPIFDEIAKKDFLFGVHMGDLHYRDIGSGVHVEPPYDEKRYREAYDDVLTYNGSKGADARQGKLYRGTPLVYIWDDHDYGPNDSDGSLEHKKAAASVYRERAPHYPLPSEDDALYQSFQVGRVLFICTDVRYDRSPNDASDDEDKSMLGADQLSWMEDLLSETDAQALVWVMPDQWMGEQEDSWASFTTERDRLVKLLGAPGGDEDRSWLSRMVMITGDAHNMGISSGETNEWGGFPIGQFAPLNSTPSPGNPE
ncbi:MAG: alkaline phosphatase D family protein, partial [Stackebrandtia sp.]